MRARALLMLALASSGCVLDYDVLRRGRGEHDGGTDMDAFVEVPDMGVTEDMGMAPDMGGPPNDVGTDAWRSTDGGALCQRDAARCDDHLFCNGVETCAPGSDAATNGCLPGVRQCTSAGQSCNETTDTCTTACTDTDGDHSGMMPCGDDCDDSDATRYPGNTEVCDVGNRDEDCNCLTFGTLDADGDGYTSDTCCNCVGTGTQHCGNDCNDGVFGINPGVTETPGGLDLNCNGSPDT